MLILFALSAILFVYSCLRMLFNWYTRKKDLRIKRLEARNRALQQRLMIEQALNSPEIDIPDKNFYHYHLN